MDQWCSRTIADVLQTRIPRQVWMDLVPAREVVQYELTDRLACIASTYNEPHSHSSSRCTPETLRVFGTARLRTASYTSRPIIFPAAHGAVPCFWHAVLDACLVSHHFCFAGVFLFLYVFCVCMFFCLAVCVRVAGEVLLPRAETHVS